MLIQKIQTCDLIIFGAKGDLACRKLFPSLYQLEKTQKICKNSRIIGVGRANWDKHTYRMMMRQALEKFMDEKIEETIWNILCQRLDFCNLDVYHISNFFQLKKMLSFKKRIIINYLAMPPNTFGYICKGLGVVKLNHPKSRIIMEKPLGNSLKTSQEINNQVGKYFKENQIFRIDHYLGKETILNLLALRFANSLFYTQWDNKSIDHIQITVAEEVGIEGRWGYFDKTGQMRDMVQNHLLQILSIIAMAPPLDLNANSIRNEKVKVLRALRLINYKNVSYNTVIGQYISGYSKDKEVPSYLNEEGANKTSNTETFVSIKVHIDNWQWIGVPFYLRTGKRLSSKCSEIVIYFKNPTLNLFKDSYITLPQNKLVIRLQPNEGIDVEFLNKIPSLHQKYQLKIAKLEFNYLKTFKGHYLSDAYERLLIESMIGTQGLFVHRDEVETAWKWVDSIIDAWKKTNQRPELYKAGSWGPDLSNVLIEKDGRSWNNF